MSIVSAEESHHHLSHLQQQQPPQPQTDEQQQTQQQLEDELRHVRESESRYKQQYVEAQRREKLLVRRLAAKEQEMQDYASQNAELKASQAPTLATLRSVLLDPAVNILFQKLKAELQSTKARLEDTQNELSAWKFTPDSNTGKRLMAKCRLLYQENEELGKMTSNGRLAKLEGDLALQKSFSEEVKKSQSELDDFLQELDEDVEGMQSTILFLQQELKLAKDTITTLERENSLLKNGGAYDNVALKKYYKDAGGGNNIDTTNTENSTEINLINGSKLSTAIAADLTAQTIHLENLSNHVVSSTASPTLDGLNAATNLNLSSYSAANNGERVQKTSLNNNCTAKNSSTSSAAPHIVLVETRTLRSSGRNINSVVDELRTSKLKAQYNNNGNNCDSAIDENSGLVVSEPSNFNETRKNGSGLIYGTSNSTGSAQSLRKPPNKRSFYDEDTSSGDDDDDDNSHSNSNLSNNNNSNKNNCKENNGSTGTVTLVGNAPDCLSSVVAIKKTRRSSVLSLDLNEEDSRIDLKADEHPLNLVTSASSAAAASQSDPLASPQNGII